MRNLPSTVLSAADNQNTNGTAINMGQIFASSWQVIFGDTQAAGTLKLQASNDLLENTLTLLNWTDIPNQSATITSGSSALLTMTSSPYQWVRAVYTTTATGAQTIALVADVSGSLKSTYFLLQDEASAHSYYVWFNNGSGVDPAIAGRTGVPITYVNNDSAATIGALVTTAIGALNSSNSFTTSGTSTVTVTNKTAGPFVPMTDGAAPTHFTFTVTAGGKTTVTVKLNAIGV